MKFFIAYKLDGGGRRIWSQSDVNSYKCMRIKFFLILTFTDPVYIKKHNFSVIWLVKGILIFFDQRIREMFDLKLFVDADPDIRLARRGNCWRFPLSVHV